MDFDFSKLSGRIVEKFGTRVACAAAVEMSEFALYNRLNNKVPFTVDEVYTLSAPNCLDIPAEEIPTYFFTPKVR